MSELMRRKDWAATPLGPVEQWPETLRLAVSMALTCRFPMNVLWGPDFRMFYNDGYRAILGVTKHPQYLGEPARECWPEVWDRVSDRLEHVRATGEQEGYDELLLTMHRNGFAEETYFNISYSPIVDSDGSVLAVISTSAEITRQVLSERRLKMLQRLRVVAHSPQEAAELSAHLLEGCEKDLPFALMYVVDPEPRLVGQFGWPEGHAADSVPWPLAQVIETGQPQLVEGLHSRFGLDVHGAWPEPVDRALVLPMTGKTPAVLVAGLSPRLP